MCKLVGVWWVSVCKKSCCKTDIFKLVCLCDFKGAANIVDIVCTGTYRSSFLLVWFRLGGGCCGTVDIFLFHFFKSFVVWCTFEQMIENPKTQLRLGDLPKELILTVLRKLKPKDLSSAAAVCRLWYKLVRDI